MLGPLFDLGGTFLRAALMSETGTLCWFTKSRICSIVDDLPALEIWQRILNTMLEYIEEHEEHVEIGSPIVISFPGPIGNSQEVLQAPTVVGAGNSGFDLPNALSAVIGSRVVVLNDVSAAAWRVAEQVPTRRFAVVTVSSGSAVKFSTAVTVRGL